MPDISEKHCSWTVTSAIAKEHFQIAPWLIALITCDISAIPGSLSAVHGTQTSAPLLSHLAED